jgi:hypothetical protein
LVYSDEDESAGATGVPVLDGAADGVSLVAAAVPSSLAEHAASAAAAVMADKAAHARVAIPDLIMVSPRITVQRCCGYHLGRC